MFVLLRILFLFLMLSTSVWANPAASSWYTEQADKKILIHVSIFLSSTCPHCQKAELFFAELEKNTPWLQITRYTINQDKKSLELFNQLLMAQGMYDFAVPSTFFCDSRWVGFVSAETTGKDLLRALTYCKQQIEQQGQLSAVTIKVLRNQGKANLLNSAMIEHPSAIKYSTFIALIDAFNSCSLFVLGAFFAILFISKTRKEQLTNGFLFLVTIGLVHFFHQAYLSSFFAILAWLRVPAILVGLFAFYVVGQYYRKRPVDNLLAPLALLLALMIQAYQQSCLMNWANVFEQWLNEQTMSSVMAWWYQWIYQLTYLLPLALLLLLYVLVVNTKRLAAFKSGLVVIGLLFILIVGLFLIIYPLALSELLLSVLLLLAVGLVAIVLKWTSLGSN